jgi:phospholipase/lecithinase/hemolysin
MKGKTFTSIVVFGDGLNDMGRWGKLTGYRYPPATAGFFESRWTNGRTWVEHFADSLGLPLSLENNFALGGATTGLYNINEPLRSLLGVDSRVPLNGMLGQVQEYLSGRPSIDKGTLFVLWAGGHDVGNYLEYEEPDLKQFPPSENCEQAVLLLQQAGARHIFIGTMPDMGYTPSYFGTAKQKTASDLCYQLNAGLKEIERAFAGSEVTIYLFDGGKVFGEVGSNPLRYGIKHTGAYLPFDIIDFSKPLAEPKQSIPNKEEGLHPDEFMSWWALSASAKVHTIIAEEAVKFIHPRE